MKLKLIMMLFFIATITQAQGLLTGLLTDGNYRGTDITSTLGDTNTVFSDTTTYGDWELVGDSILVASNDSTLLAILHGGTAQLPLSSTDGQDYRVTFSAKEYDGSVAPQPIISYGTKSLTQSALTDSWQTYSFDFEGDVVNDYLEFDGMDDQVTLGDVSTLEGIDEFTVEAYFQVVDTTSSAEEAIFGKWDNVNNERSLYLYRNATDKILLGVGNGTTYHIDAVDLGTEGISLANWLHIIARYRGAEAIDIFVDGDSVAVSNFADNGTITTTHSSGEPFYIGRVGASGGSARYGENKIAIIRMWDRALTSSEITTLYNNRESTTATTVTDSLVLDLNGIDGNLSSTTWTDASGNGNDGTISGATLRQPPYLEISLSDTAKVKIDDVVLKR